MTTPYELLGGEAGVKELAKVFYQTMDEMPETAGIRAMHGDHAKLAVIEEKLFWFLSGWLGGPSLYQDNMGTICITKPHKPYPIDADARDQWMLCMEKTLQKMNVDERVWPMIREPLTAVAEALRTDG